MHPQKYDVNKQPTSGKNIHQYYLDLRRSFVSIDGRGVTKNQCD